ncbi:MAG: hypothetical protein Q4C77_02730 [Eubacteriales bacterium]|nr:hypothetical protein [Eubacteriales bacterium]
MLEKWLVRHWKALCSGCILTGIAIRIAYAERGYMAFGSEWLIIPVAFAIERFARNKSRSRGKRCRTMNRSGRS